MDDWHGDDPDFFERNDDVPPCGWSRARDTSKYRDAPGYLDPIADPRLRRRHRDAVRAQAIRDDRVARVEPSAHQMAALVLDALGLALAAGGSRNGVTRAFSDALREAAMGTGWELSPDLMRRIRTRLQPSTEVAANLHRMREAARAEEARHRRRLAEEANVEEELVRGWTDRGDDD